MSSRTVVIGVMGGQWGRRCTGRVLSEEETDALKGTRNTYNARAILTSCQETSRVCWED